jgi:hypothetical protein
LEIDRLCTIQPVVVAKHPDSINREGGGNGSILCNMDEKKRKLSIVMMYKETEHKKIGKSKNMPRPETIHNFLMTEGMRCDVFLSPCGFLTLKIERFILRNPIILRNNSILFYFQLYTE